MQNCRETIPLRASRETLWCFTYLYANQPYTEKNRAQRERDKELGIGIIHARAEKDVLDVLDLYSIREGLSGRGEALTKLIKEDPRLEELREKVEMKKDRRLEP